MNYTGGSPCDEPSKRLRSRKLNDNDDDKDDDKDDDRDDEW